MQDEPALEILATGPLSLLEDEGRPGWAHLGVTGSGAADRRAYRAANLLVGNRPGAACIETVLGGLQIRAWRTLLVATTGADAAVTVQPGTASVAASDDAHTRDRRASPPRPATDRYASIERHHPVGYSLTLFPGDVLTVEQPASGLRTYLAVRGGLEAERTLGSRSSDVLSGLGPAALRAGDVLGISDEGGEWPASDFARIRRATPVLHLLRGPRDDWFGEAGWATLLAAEWMVGTDSNRVGVRLESRDTVAVLPTFADRELASEGMVSGAVQVPPSGKPVVFLRDHPVTGGYPVIAVLTDGAIDAAAQLRPGDAVSFVEHR